MSPVIPSTLNNVQLIPGIPFITRKQDGLKKLNLTRCFTRQTRSPQKHILTLSTSVRLFPQLRSNFSMHHKTRATGTDVAVEEAESPVSNEDLPPASAESSATSAPTTSPAQSKRSKPTRKSEMPPVKQEELVPGATFTGKVRSVQPFGAFVDFGAFTDGLVHVSQLSDGFVKDVGNFVSIGQEVTVRLLEVNVESSRISLSMRESEDKKGPSETSKPPRKGPPRSNQKREDTRKASKFAKGQDLEGTVKNLTRSGAFISLPEGEEGFLPQDEEMEEGFANMMGGSSLHVGQEVSVRVLRFSRGKVTLTMKKEEAVGELDSKLNSGVVHKATNPFLLAFRKNEDISSFLDEREKEEEPSVEEKVEVNSKVAAVEENVSVREEISGTQVGDDVAKNEVEVPQSSVVEDVSSPTLPEDEKVEASLEDSDTLTNTTEKVTDEVENVVEEVAESQADDIIAKDENKETVTEESSSITSSSTIEETEVSKEIENEVKTETPDAAADDVPSATLAEEEKVESTPEETSTEIEESKVVENVIDTLTLPIEEAEVEQVAEEKSAVTNSSEEINEQSTNENTTIEIEESKVVENMTETPTTSIKEAEVEPVLEEKSPVTNSSEEISEQSTNENTTKATISPALVKQLRDETGAGMMDCKKALSETEGDLVKAQEFLRKKGLASADKKSSRATAEGRIGSYIHDSRIGVLIEVNCETDFVSRGDIFKELVDDLAMQVAACPQVQYLATDDVDKELVEKERAIEMQKEDLLSKPEQIREKIVDGRIRKRLEELALLEQAYIKNDKMVVKDWVKQTIATVGENIKVKRFVRFNLGEGLEKRSQDFAAEVAAQTAAKSGPAAVKDQPAAVVEEKAADEPKTVISAALVKQLREESGAGMMDCKKALSETGGDLVKAQEYLRKKGLSAADKKSSRIAAEGRIGAYIHDSRIGVLIEINCETDFVGRSERFKELVDDLAMQVAACPQVQYVSIEDIPEEIVAKEKAMEMQREDLLSKPENIREKIVEGRVSKMLSELALLEQPFVKDDSVLVKDLVKQTIAGLGENIKVRRFVRFTLGEANEITEVAENEA